MVVLRTGEPAVPRPLRRLHTGSVDDYAMFSAVGIVVCAATLLG